MTRTLAVTEHINTLNQAHAKLNLRRNTDPHWFAEWFNHLPELIDQEREFLDRLKQRYLYHSADGPLSEGTVNLLIVSPLLDFAGLYNYPFKLRAQSPVEIVIEDEAEILRGQIDILTVQERFWCFVVESKRDSFSAPVAIPQALAYMMGNPYPDRDMFGMVTNGEDFIFIKLTRQGGSQYDLSDKFTLLTRRSNQLYDVLQVLKQIGYLIAQS